MKTVTKSFTVVALFFSTIVIAQQSDGLIKADSTGKQNNNINRRAYNARTEIHFDTYFILLGNNFKQQLIAPLRLTKQDLSSIGKFGLIAVGLSFADEPVQEFSLNLRKHQAVRNISSRITNLGAQYEGITLVALGTYGFLFKNEKIQTTTLLATQAYITSSVMQAMIKKITGRQRPSYYDPIEQEAEPKFHGPFHKPFKDANGSNMSYSFPSGHATLAFAAATVYAMEFKDRPLVPIISYTTASLIGLSRISENRHWATDVLAGAALGYLIGRQVVNNYHRYAKSQESKQKKNSLSFSVQYNYGQLTTGIVYNFR
jgi:membrane-associated PAP2 superfamily phosphatase